jgi:hypothetical protein
VMQAPVLPAFFATVTLSHFELIARIHAVFTRWPSKPLRDDDRAGCMPTSLFE